ncbi:MAG: hypothetical protein IPP30_04675 [Flavobacterium sp.]|nr:hypothetical protein [Flavobacterium sp.]
MENNDLGSKKMNNKQESTSINNPSTAAMHPEIEADQLGVKKVVNRARQMDQNIADFEFHAANELGSKPSTAPEALGKKMVENSDKNSDITSTRYPNSHPDNHENRGNI